MRWVHKVFSALAELAGRFLGDKPRSPFEGIFFTATRSTLTELKGRLATA